MLKISRFLSNYTFFPQLLSGELGCGWYGILSLPVCLIGRVKEGVWENDGLLAVSGGD